MPRARTGTLVYKRTTGWNARIWVDVKDETTGAIRQERRWVPLETHDKDLAKRKLAKIVAMLDRGEIVADIKAEAKRELTLREYDAGLNEQRRTAGIRTVCDEEGWQRRCIHPELGGLELSRIRPTHVRTLLGGLVERGLRRNSIRTVRAVLFRSMRAAWEAELIPENPVARVRIPKMNETKKARTILTDDEIALFMTNPTVSPELKVLSFTARTEGGMRSGDLLRWTWRMIDTATFASCTIPRAKKGIPQTLEIPAVLAPILREWWTVNGSPVDGPVFPVRRGERVGEARKARGVSFAKALRRELLRAGVVRHACSGSCFRDESPTPCANLRFDSLYNETETTMPVDFHSFRRAFNTALAEAGVNVQQAMHLAGHSDPKVHSIYVMATKRMQRIPPAALPQLGKVTVLPKR